MKDATYLLHVASPVVYGELKDHSELVRPAVNGTISALKGATKHKLKKVIITCSLITIMD